MFEPNNRRASELGGLDFLWEGGCDEGGIKYDILISVNPYV